MIRVGMAVLKFATESPEPWRAWGNAAALPLASRDAMTSGAKTSLPIGPARWGLALFAGAMLLVASLAAAAQESKPASDPSAPETTPAHQPGMVDKVGRWFKDSFGRLGSSVDGARTSLGGLGDSASDAADAVARLPNARVVEGHARCAIAANGAPDCRKAAEAVCKNKGFGSGSSLNIQSAQKCPARAWLGRAEPGDCEVQSFVTRAMCQ